MGNTGSNTSLNAIALARLIQSKMNRPEPPPDPNAVCNAKRVEIGQLQSDVTKKQNEIDSCFPGEAEERRVNAFIEENNKFIREKSNEFDRIATDVRRPVQIMEKIKNTEEISQDYVNKLRNEQKELELATEEMDQTERRYRRRFLDGNPQEGVPYHILGFQTSDDMVMALFWTASLVILSVAAYYGRTHYELSWTVVASIYVVPLAISYFCITMFG